MIQKKFLHYADIRAPNGQTVPVYACIKWDGERLNIIAVEGPMANGNCVGRRGKVIDQPEHINLAHYYAEFVSIWHRWDLNGMREGSHEQTLMLVAHFGAKRYTLQQAIEFLASKNMEIDSDGYLYGDDWLFEEVPKSIIRTLFNAFPSFPENDVPAAWRNR